MNCTPCETHRRASAELERLIQSTTTADEIKTFGGDQRHLLQAMAACPDCTNELETKGGDLTMAARLNRNQRRAGARLLDGSRAYIRAAAESLGFSDQQLAEAQSGAGESADILMARVFELLELQHGSVTPDCQQARAEMDRRHGAGFVARVARMGRPAVVPHTKGAQ